MIKKSIKAFTLAEVLITLTIIGVIAALTIPNLMQSYRKHQVEVGLKEAYSLLSNALNMAKAEYGDIEDTLPNTLEDFQTIWAEKYLLSYLRIAQKNVTYNTLIKLANGETKQYSFSAPDSSWYNKTILTNGMLVAFQGYEWTAVHAFNLIIFIDLNGVKKPNQLGNDIFVFTLNKTNNYNKTQYSTGFNLVAGSQIFSTGEELENAKTECGEYGRSCSVLIQKNGWKIPDDYPVKKW